MAPEEDCILVAETVNAAVGIPTKRFFCGITDFKEGWTELFREISVPL